MNYDFLYNNPLEFYSSLLLGPLTHVYTTRKETKLEEWMEYSNLLIDKFAIHSSSFFHLSCGIIEHKKSGETRRMNGYDLFTINTTIRVIIETYIAFNHIFVEPKTDKEKHFRFLLWKLDGHYQEKKYDIKLDDFKGVSKLLEDKEIEISNTINMIKESDFISNISENQLLKIFNPAKTRANWRFIITNNQVKPLQIIQLIEHCCKQRAFINTYKRSSIHTHSNFPAIEEFKRKRGKMISKEYTDPITRVAILLTCLMINDISQIDENAKFKFNELGEEMSNFITGMSKSVKE